MVYRYLRGLEGVTPPLALTQLACQAAARAFVIARAYSFISSPHPPSCPKINFVSNLRFFSLISRVYSVRQDVFSGRRCAWDRCGRAKWDWDSGGKFTDRWTTTYPWPGGAAVQRCKCSGTGRRGGGAPHRPDSEETFPLLHVEGLKPEAVTCQSAPCQEP